MPWCRQPSSRWGPGSPAPSCPDTPYCLVRAGELRDSGVRPGQLSESRQACEIDRATAQPRVGHSHTLHRRWDAVAPEMPAAAPSAEWRGAPRAMTHGSLTPSGLHRRAAWSPCHRCEIHRGTAQSRVGIPPTFHRPWTQRTPGRASGTDSVPSASANSSATGMEILSGPRAELIQKRSLLSGAGRRR
jgi:hypothetical protein